MRRTYAEATQDDSATLADLREAVTMLQDATGLEGVLGASTRDSGH